MSLQKLDLIGLKCPMPVLRTKKFLATLPSGSIITVVTTDPDAKKDLQNFCIKSGHVLLSQSMDKEILITQIKCK